MLLDRGLRLGKRCSTLGLAPRFCNRWAADGIGFVFRWHRLEGRRLLSAICGMICLVVARSGAENTFDGVYTGKRVVTKGSGPTCLGAQDVSVAIGNGVLTVTSGQYQGFALGFNPQPDGSFDETYVGNGGGYVDIRGRIVGDWLDADVTDPHCEHHWHLKKEHQSQ